MLLIFLMTYCFTFGSLRGGSYKHGKYSNSTCLFGNKMNTKKPVNLCHMSLILSPTTRGERLCFRLRASRDTPIGMVTSFSMVEVLHLPGGRPTDSPGSSHSGVRAVSNDSSSELGQGF